MKIDKIYLWMKIQKTVINKFDIVKTKMKKRYKFKR